MTAPNAPRHVADVFFGQFVVCQVNRLELLLDEFGRDLGAFAFALCAQAQKYMGFVRVAHAVVELGHALIELVVFLEISDEKIVPKIKTKSENKLMSNFFI